MSGRDITQWHSIIHRSNRKSNSSSAPLITHLQGLAPLLDELGAHLKLLDGALLGQRGDNHTLTKCE